MQTRESIQTPYILSQITRKSVQKSARLFLSMRDPFNFNPVLNVVCKVNVNRVLLRQGRYGQSKVQPILRHLPLAPFCIVDILPQIFGPRVN